MSDNLVGRMLVGRVDLGGSFQACPANYSSEDAMARSIVRLECEAEELRAEVAMQREQARILARERDEAREAAAKWESSSDAMERAGAEQARRADENREWAVRLERERDEAREQRDQIENQLELMTCKAAGWQNQATIEAKALVECWEKAERYLLEANAMMAKLHELQTYADKLADGLPAGMLPRDVENLREANAGLADDLQKAERERDNLKSEKEANYQCLLILERDLYKAREERDKAISVADRLIEYAHECLVKLESWGQGYQRYEEEMDTIREDIAAYDMMKEALK